MDKDYLYYFYWDNKESSLVIRVKKEYRDTLRAPSSFSIVLHDEDIEYRLPLPLENESEYPHIISFLEYICTSEEENIPLSFISKSPERWLALNPKLSELIFKLIPTTGVPRREILSAEEAMKKVKLAEADTITTLCRVSGPGNFSMMIDKNVCMYGIESYALELKREKNIHSDWRVIGVHDYLKNYQYLGFFVGFAVLFSLELEEE